MTDSEKLERNAVILMVGLSLALTIVIMLGQ